MKPTAIEISMYRISKLLKDKNWSQRELAQKIGVTQQTVQQWISGKSTPKPASLDKLSEVTGYDIDWFYRLPEKDEEVSSIENSNGFNPHNTDKRGQQILSLIYELPEKEVVKIMSELKDKTDYYRTLFEELKVKHESKKHQTF